MKKTAVILILSLFSFAEMYSQTCNEDSVVITYFSHSEDWFIDFILIKIDSFDVVNGTLNSCEQSGFMSLPGPFTCQQKLFTRRFLQLSSSGDTLIYSSHPGTGIGYVNESRVEKLFDSLSGKVLSRKEFNGNGQTWTPSMEETWTYDSLANLLNYERISDQGNSILEKDSLVIYNYASGILQSVLYQDGVGANWIDLLLFSYSYNSSGQKDSVHIQKPDSTGINWVDSLQGYYDPSNNFFANYLAVVHDTSGILVDSLTINFDTLNNVRTYKLFYDYFFNLHDEYDFVGNSWYKKIYNGSYDGCGSRTDFLYDQLGVSVGYDKDGGGCGHGYHSDLDIIYDSLYRPLSYHSLTSVLHTNSYDSVYFYNSPTKISLHYIPVTEMGVTVCNGDTVQPFLIITGGCGPYSFSWQPSTGLSSDTVASPLIFVNDSIIYTITVTDSIGNTEIINYTVRPTYLPTVSVGLFPGTCNMDSARFYPSYQNAAGSGVTIQWYLNGVYDTTSHFKIFRGLQAGDSISCFLTTTNLPCSQQSTAFGYYIFDLPSTPIISYSLPSLFSTQAFAYQWYFNQVQLFGETNQSLVPQNTGNYTVRIWDSAGCSVISAPYYFQITNVIENQHDQFLIYPNPASTSIYLNGIDENIEIELYDVYGSLMQTIQSGVSSSLEIDLSKFPAGSYIISLRNDKIFLTKRVTIIR